MMAPQFVKPYVKTNKNDALVPDLIEDASNDLPGRFRLLIDRLLQHLKELDRQVRELEREIEQWHRSSIVRPDS